ncbi:hypothetical protein KQI63_04015 [bacterium]|nr:hypothetical protein [bacterium]
MTTLTLTLRDLLWFGSLLVTVVLAYSRLQAEIRHLQDVKAERAEVQRLVDHLRDTLAEIRTSLVRLEAALRVQGGGQREEEQS